ncbi:MAG: ABC transporter substrate-binding protein, partial [Steroidobacteraceae bacterium]
MAHEQTPYRIGLCSDASSRTESRDFVDAVRMALDEATLSGAIDRIAELEILEVSGPRVSDIVHAWRTLVHDRGVLAAIGPHTADAAQSVAPEANAIGVPTLSATATLQFAGEYCYSLGAASGTEEAALLAQLAAHVGSRIAVLRADTFSACECIEQLRVHASERGLHLVGETTL